MYFGDSKIDVILPGTEQIVVGSIDLTDYKYRQYGSNRIICQKEIRKNGCSILVKTLLQF